MQPRPIPTPSRSTRRTPASAGAGNVGTPGSYSKSPGFAVGSFGSPRTAGGGGGVVGSPLPSSRLKTPRTAGLGMTPGRASGTSKTSRVPTTLPSHQQLQQALQGGGETVGIGGSPLSGDLGSFAPIRQKNVSRVSEDRGEEAEDEREDDGYEEETEEAEDEGEDDEVMEEVLLPGMSGPNPGEFRGIENNKSIASGGGSGFFGSMEIDDNSGDKTEEDLDPDPQTEEVATTTDTGEIGGSTTDDGARRRGTITVAVLPKKASKAPAPPIQPTSGQVTRGSTKENVRERERKKKEARDKVMMPPPQTVKRNLNTTAVGGVKPPRGKEATSSTRVRIASTTTDSTLATTGGLNRSTSVRRGSATKEEGGVCPVPKPRGSFDAKTPVNSTGSNTQTRHSRTRSVTGVSSASVPRPKHANSANANTGTDSEDPAVVKRPAAPAGATKKPRPASMFIPSTKPTIDREPDGSSSPTQVVSTITRSRQQPPPKDSPVTSIARKASARTTAPHRRNQSEAQPTERKHTRPDFTTLQKDYSALPLPSTSSQSTTSTNTILIDAPTLQKQTHLLQLILLHDTAIQSFQSFHIDAHAKLSKRHHGIVELYQNTRGRLVADAHAADMYMLRKVLQSEPAVPPTGGVARWGTAAGRRLSGSREHLAGGSTRRKTLTGDMASPVEERIQVFSESLKRIEGLLRKGGEVSRVRVAWDTWVTAWKAGKASEDGLPKQWHRDWATTKRKVEVAMDGVRDFWGAYQHVLSEKQQKKFVSTAMTEKGLGLGGGGDGDGDGDGGGGGGGGGGGEGGGGTLFRILIGFLELGEDVVRELDEMKALERVFLEEARERMRKVVREVLAEKVVVEGMEGSEVIEGVEVEVAGASQGVGRAWRM